MTEASLEQRAENDYHQNLEKILATLGKIPYIVDVKISLLSADNRIRIGFSVLKYGRTDFESLVKKIIEGNKEHHAAGYIKIVDELKTSQKTGDLFDSWSIDIDAQAKDPKARTRMNANIVARTEQVIGQYYNERKDYFPRDVKPPNGKQASNS